MRRLEVKPGMTGVWQVSGRSNLPFDEMFYMDLYYVEELVARSRRGDYDADSYGRSQPTRGVLIGLATLHGYSASALENRVGDRGTGSKSSWAARSFCAPPGTPVFKRVQRSTWPMCRRRA